MYLGESIHITDWFYISFIEKHGVLAQLGEHLVRNQGVVGSNPISSTMDSRQDCNGPVFLYNGYGCDL